jgi:hypothetical protein
MRPPTSPPSSHGRWRGADSRRNHAAVQRGHLRHRARVPTHRGPRSTSRFDTHSHARLRLVPPTPARPASRSAMTGARRPITTVRNGSALHPGPHDNSRPDLDHRHHPAPLHTADTTPGTVLHARHSWSRGPWDRSAQQDLLGPGPSPTQNRKPPKASSRLRTHALTLDGALTLRSALTISARAPARHDHRCSMAPDPVHAPPTTQVADASTADLQYRYCNSTSNRAGSTTESQAVLACPPGRGRVATTRRTAPPRSTTKTSFRTKAHPAPLGSRRCRATCLPHARPP